MTKQAIIEIEHCNGKCPYFFHNYDDYDNIWCGHEKMKKRIFDLIGLPNLVDDCKPRKIPEDCPLEDI
jgi:hypothetical protein